jgi:putative NADH-flavin reductase
VKLSLFGATGALGRECLAQSLEARHELTVLARTPEKLPAELRDRIDIVQGDGLAGDAVGRAIPPGTEAVLFAIGVERGSPEDLCTEVTRYILAAMRERGVRRFVWCGGGSTLVPDDVITFGARFVELFSRTFLGLRHRDKLHQLALLEASRDVDWLGVRPLQMNRGPRRGQYRLGFDAFSGLSKIHFADCADAMLGMLHDDSWLHKAPIIQY